MRSLTGLVLIALSACDRPAPAPSDAPAWFEERAEAAGIDFVYRSGHRERHLLPEIMGGGAALFDVDSDGDLDLYLVQAGREGETDMLYRNRGDGTFTQGEAVPENGYGMGVATGDYDSDGDLDLYVTNCGPNMLLRNDNGVLTDVTGSAGVGHPGWGTASGFLDADGDGHLDLFLVNYLNWSEATELVCYNDVTGVVDYCSPGAYKAPTADVLYLNNGDGTFRDASEAAGLTAGLGTGLGLVTGDFTGDGRPDVFVANDGMMDRLWVNQGSGRFEDQALMLGCAVDEDGKPKAGMGVVSADLDDDGDADLMVCNLRSETDSLYRNDGAGFVDATAASGLAVTSKPYTRFGMGWVDLDHDGWIDLYQANGRVMQYAWSHATDPFAEPNLLFRGNADGRFTEVAPRGGAAEPIVATSRAAAFGDLDGDGAIDVLVVNRDAPVSLLMNRRGADGAWIMFRVIDEHGADALGAQVRMRVGNRTITRDVRTAYSYLAANDPRVHVGLGPASGVTDVEVRWPDGTVQSFGDRAAGAVHELRR